ncbi:uncharacterized protein YNL200C [Kluyveromyces marxianus]|uniref:NAD(P)H-hydrate epimerase n=2 Tax=Kluyveromyces marxianus TaxID=4911 RepID=W0T9C9_KLUMD|nr:uncharacterized protein KLMA_40208 [Kluyveromyces marxianus DMKU3-1042]QGN15967.1 YNL200C [Kluyveromyces marxianus]BAO40232.1 uncharacterized protein YNL200C [Kluyveromyces marxianus DMKU3-1042]BAP71723.1 uncharacterized protein YNL200C [Kluyveromyces marxianus]
MSFKTVSSKVAATIDQELMGPVGFTLQQLMELAGLSVAQAVLHQFPVQPSKNQVLVISGPGNNGGDGLVCARHLKLFGYEPVVYYPKRSGREEFYGQLVKQLEFFNVPVLGQGPDEGKWVEYLEHEKTVCVVDSMFGFSFHPPLREPFNDILSRLKKLENKVPIVAVDVPSGWDVDNGPVDEKSIQPNTLVSLTVPKPCAKFLKPEANHYVGGRFVPKHFAQKYGFEPFEYQGGSQVLKL